MDIGQARALNSVILINLVSNDIYQKSHTLSWVPLRKAFGDKTPKKFKMMEKGRTLHEKRTFIVFELRDSNQNIS